MLIFAAVACLSAMSAEQTKICAHRGHWLAPGSAQNSIRSLVKTDSIGADYMEMDVYMTPDGELVVRHDAIINGYKVIETDSKILRAQKLENGENLPSLAEILEAAKSLKVGLMIELEWCTSQEREIEEAKKCVNLVKEYGLTDRVVYVSFSGTIVNTLASVTDRPVMYLFGEIRDPDYANKIGATGCDFGNSDWSKHPEYFKRCKELGLAKGVWVLDGEDEIMKALEAEFEYITTNEPELALRVRRQFEAKKNKQK